MLNQTTDTQMQELLLSTDFSGLGSPEEALKRLNVPHRVVFACEKDKFARASYLANHAPDVFYDDVTTRDNASAPYSDCYVFGFPCQAFSIAGKQKGFEDTRGTLFFKSLEYIDKKRPRTFIGENVKGLLSHDSGRTFRTIIDCLAVSENGQQNLYPKLDCVGYHVFYAVHNTKNFGIPQNRERIFIVGFRDEADALCFKQPKGFPLQLKLKDLLQDNPYHANVLRSTRTEYGKKIRKEYEAGNIEATRCEVSELKAATDGICNTLTSVQKDNLLLTFGPAPFYEVPEKYYLSDKALEYIVKDSGNWSDRLSMMNYDTADTALCITANHHKGVPYNMLQVAVNEATKQGYAVAEVGDSINLSVPTSTTRRGRVGKGTANTLDTQCNQAVVVDGVLSIKPKSVLLELIEFLFTFEYEKTKRNPSEILQKLQQSDVSEEVQQWVFNVIASFFKNGILRQVVHERGNEKSSAQRQFFGNNKNKSCKGGQIDIKGQLFYMWKSACIGCTPQGRKSIKQLIRQFGSDLSELPYKEAQDKTKLFIAWMQQTPQRKRVLREALSKIQKIRHPLRVQRKPTLKCYNSIRIRRLTPREVFRLQGYSDEFFDNCQSVNSDSQLYKQAGNSITVDTIMHVMKQVLIAIGTI